MMTFMALRRLVCSLLFIIANLIYCGLVSAGYIGPVGGIIWGVIGIAWIMRLGKYRKHHRGRRFDETQT